jgi:hypothetical protein
MGALAGVVAGEKLFEAAGMAVPAWYTHHIAANRFGTGAGACVAGKDGAREERGLG